MVKLRKDIISKTKGFNLTKSDILDFLKDNKEFLSSAYSVEKIGVFGSYAKDIAKSDSDIDFYVIFKNKTLDNITGLWLYLEEVFDKKIDLIHYHSRIRDGLKKQIESEILYA